MGQTNDSLSTLYHMLGDKHSRMVLLVGDLSYADCEQSRWDSWGNMIELIASRKPLMVGAGNHEIEIQQKAGKAFTSFESRYRMPQVRGQVYE